MNEIERTIRELQLYVDVRWGGSNDMFNLELTALREKAERSKGCVSCDGGFGDNTVEFKKLGYTTCPYCGKRLEVEQG